MSTPSRCFSLLVLFCACFHLPSLAGVHGDANSTISCDYTKCANLGNNPYPFGGSAACAASPSYVLSNCTPSSRQASWGSFSDAALGVVGSPAVTAVTAVTAATYNEVDYPGASSPSPADYEFGYSGMSDYFASSPSPADYEFAYSDTSDYFTKVIFELSWNRSLSDLDPCPPLFSSRNLSLYNIPSSINLTRFPNSSALSFTTDNTILLFNCARKASDDVVADLRVESRLGCMRYKELCGSLAKTPCIQWVVSSSTEVLMLQHVMDTLACSHFMFGTLSLQSYKIFTPAVFELLWRDLQCHKCKEAYGICIPEAASRSKFNRCECYNASTIDFNTQKCDSVYNGPGPNCYGGPLQCNMGAKVGVGVAVGIVGVLGIYVLVKFGLPVVISILKKLQSVTIPVVISILKKILRKLQSVSYRHKRFLDLLDLDGLTERPTEYFYGSLASATKSFSSLLGEGGFGTVYKGTLTAQASKSHGGGSEQQIAVKVLEAKSKHSKKHFLNEVATIGKIHHVNVVRLLGFCMQEDHEMLVYEYVVNGSLDKWLFNKKGKPQEHVVDWGQRFTIALGVARGLSYLHEQCRHRTVHCDVKPQNILLDADMHPKIADFGLARLMSRDESKVVTFAKGTPGYMAPEFWRGGESQLSTKFDVYSYGMVLLELISGHQNFDAIDMENGSSFPAMAFKGAMEGDLESIVDPRLDIMSDGDEVRKQVQWQQIKTVAFIALWCIQDHPIRRPHMSEVVKYLEGGATVSKCPPQPTISTSCASYPQLFTGSHHDNECTTLSVGQ